MDEGGRKKPGDVAKAERAARVAEVMRENLRKRKAQGRAREARDEAGKAGDGGSGEGEKAGGG